MMTALRRRLPRKWIVPLLCFVAWAGVPLSSARAADIVLEVDHDARLEGYGRDTVAIEESNSAMTWVGFTILCLIALLGIFTDATRTHLD
jgi:hypothetical protein